MKNSFLLKNGFFLLNDGSGKLLKGSMRVEEGKISRIAKTLTAHKKEKVIDLKGKLVIPGFVQTHLHLCQTLFRNLADDLELLDWLRLRIWPMESAHTEKSLYSSARLGIAELLAGGTTTILDMGTVRHTEVIFAAAEEMGIRAFIGKCLMDREENPFYLRESFSEASKENRKLMDRWHGKENGRLRYAHAPRFLLSASEKMMREIGAISAETSTLIHTHSSENKSEIEAVRKLYGCENVEAFDRLGVADEKLVLAHCIHLSEKEEKILKKKKVKVSHCPSSNLKLASGICRVMDLRAKGISVSLGADGAACNNQLSAFQEMRLASLIQKPLKGPTALPAREAFEMATIEGARALGLGDVVGSLEVGKEADFVILSQEGAFEATEWNEKEPENAYSALVYSLGPAQVQSTWVRGLPVFHQGTFPGISATGIRQEAVAERKKLLDRARKILSSTDLRP